MISRLGKRILLWVLVLVVFPLGLVSVVVYHQGKKIVKEQIYTALNITADSIEAQVLNLIDAKKNRLRDFASDGFIRSHLKKINEEPNNADAKKELGLHLVRNKRRLDRDIMDIFIFNRKGKAVALATVDGLKRDHVENGHFLMGREGLAMGTVEGLSAGRHFHVSAPIAEHVGNGFLGVITVGFNATAIDNILAGMVSGRHGAKPVFGDLDMVYITDSGKTIIASRDAALVGKKADTELLRRTLSEKKGTTAEFAGIFGNEMVGASMYIRETGWVVIASVSKKGIFAPLDNLAYAAFSLIFGGIIVVISMTVLFAKKVTGSLDEVAHFATRLAHGSLGERISIEGKKDEIAELGAAFNGMAAKLQGTVNALIEREERLAVLNRFYSVLLKVNEAIIRLRGEEELFNESCRICVDEGLFRFVWVGMADAGTSLVRPVARYGVEDGFLDDIRISGGSVPEVLGPAGAAVREGRYDVCNDMESDPRTGPWRAEALKRGYRSMAAFPLRTDMGVVGAFVYYADSTGYFNQENIALLERMTGDISYAMEFIRKEALRREAEDALQENERKYRTLVENLPQRIFLKDTRGVFVSCNSSYAAGLNIRPEEIAGKTDFDFYPKELAEKYRANDREVMESGSIASVEESYAGGGLTFHVNTVKVPVKDEAGCVAGILGIFSDITPFKRSEEEKAKLEAQIRHMQKMDAIGRLTGGIAHDFNNLLMAIIGNATLLKMRLPDDGKAMGFVEQILATSERAAKLTGGLLSLSRKQILEVKPVDLNGILRSVEKLLLSLIGEDIDLKVAAADEEMVIKADAGQIEQVLVNLAANARDAMPEGGHLSISTMPVRVDDGFVRAHGYGRPGVYALLAVSDNGAGMDAATRERIFEPFFTTKEVGKGTGLGLSIVYGIIKQHEGYINVYSEPGKGTTFRIYLPVVESSAESLKAGEIHPPRGGTETVLLAEDEPDVRRFMSAILEEFGYTVIEACDGEDAVDKFMANKEAVGLLILDVIMPRKNGKGVYDSIIAVKPGVRALFTSGYNEEIIHKKGVLEEGLNFISKPFIPSEFLRTVRALLDK